MVITGYAWSKAPDFIPNLEDATREKWGYWGLRSNIKRRSVLSELHRYFLYYWFSLLIVLKCRSCKNIITTQQFYGLIVAFYSRLLYLKKHYSLTVLTFIYKPQNSFWGNVYFKFIRYIVTSVKGDYLISVGCSNRDYKWLVDAISGTGCNLFVVNDKFAEEVHDANIQPLKSCHAKEMLELMSKTFCVIVPLILRSRPGNWSYCKGKTFENLSLQPDFPVSPITSPTRKQVSLLRKTRTNSLPSLTNLRMILLQMNLAGWL